MMKRSGILLLALMLAGTLAACRAEQAPAKQENDQSYFNAAVLELGERQMLVQVTDGSGCGLTAGSQAVVSTDTLAADGASDWRVGQPVRVVFDGTVKETAPLQLGDVFAIYPMDAEGHCIAPDGTVDFGVLPHGLCLTAKDVTPAGLTLVCTRSDEGEPELWTDALFLVERYDEATYSWTALRRLDLEEPLCYIDIAYTVPADDTVEWEFSWQGLYGPLSPGQYRVVKTIYTHDDDATVCYTGFRIPEEGADSNP